MFLTNFLWSQLFVTPPYPETDFSGKTVIVTGSNTGLGLEAARHIARLNCEKLILAVRTVSKGQTAKESIIASTSRTTDFIEVWELDMSNNNSVIAFANRAQSLPRLDVVVQNAGVLMFSFGIVEDIEQIIKVNVIGTFLLALLILPKLRETSQKFNTKTHLEIVTSEVHHMVTPKQFNLPDIYGALNDEKRPFDGNDRYNVSKALEILFVRELVKHTGSDPVITLVNPGFCHSEFMREAKGIIHAVVTVMKSLLARTTEVGSRTLVAGAHTGTRSHGQYMSDGDNQEVSSWVTSPEGVKLQKATYEQTLAILERIQPGIGGNI